jgi:hypothetical protein
MGTRTEKKLQNTFKHRAKDGRLLVRADSRPKEATTNFTMRGDSLTGIGDGKVMKWDFSNSDDDVTAPENFKRKRIEVGFSDEVWVKEGTLYFKDAPKGSYLDMYVVCKTGGYYVDPNGTIPASALGKDGDEMYTQATEDTIVTHYVNHHLMVDTVLIGDELNTEGAMEDALPKQQQGYMIWIEITTPDSDSTSYGHADLELYRKRTVLLPGEDL